MLLSINKIRTIYKICKIYFRTPQIVYNVHNISYENFLAVSNDISVPQKHLILFIDLYKRFIEVYKSLMKTNPDFMWDFDTIKPVPYDLLTGEKLYLPTVNTTCYGLNSLIFCGSLFWNNLLTSIKISQSLTGL